MPLQVLAADKSADAEQKMFDALRALDSRERARLASRHNDNATALMRVALRVARLGWSGERLSIEWTRIHHGEELASRLSEAMGQPHKSTRSTGTSTWSMAYPETDSLGLRVLSPVASALDEVGAPWFIGGSMAACANGYGRPHRDIDIIAPGLSREHVKYLQEVLGDEFFCCEAEVNGIAVWNFVHLASAWTADVFAPALEDYEREVLRLRYEAALFGGDAHFWIESPLDSILSRLRWVRATGRRGQSWEDAVGVMKVHGIGLDFDYLDLWARDLGVADLLEKALDESGLKEIKE